MTYQIRGVVCVSHPHFPFSEDLLPYSSMLEMLNKILLNTSNYNVRYTSDEIYTTYLFPNSKETTILWIQYVRCQYSRWECNGE